MPYTCQCCFKTYTTKSWYDKHIIWCTDTPHNTKIALEELDDVPPPLTMYKMILDLSMKVKNLENKSYEDVEKIYLTRKKIYSLADFKVNCDNMDKAQIVQKILNFYEN